MNILKSLFFTIIDTLFPKDIEIKSLEQLAKVNKLTDLPKSALCPEHWMHALFRYQDKMVRSLVWQIKFHGNETLIHTVGVCIAEEILAYIEERGEFLRGEWLIMPIPTTKKHRKERGFNQTELLCEEIIKDPAFEMLLYNPHVLIKRKETLPQTKIKQKQKRIKNIAGSFAITNANYISGKHIIVIDDVITTGSTLLEAKRVLMKAGARSVIAFAIAH